MTSAPLKRLRKARKLSQADLAERVGRSRSYISQMETGARDGSRDTVRKLAAALGCSVADLLEEADGEGGRKIRRDVPKSPSVQRPATRPVQTSEGRALAEFRMLQDRRRQLVADLNLVDARLETLLRVI